MGLKQRRKVKELRDVILPGRVKEIEEICGAPIPYEIDWPRVADEAGALNFIDKIFSHRLNMALRTICQDEMGKEAVCEGLRVVKLKNVKDKPSTIRFHAGALVMYCDYSAIAGLTISDREICQVLENGL